MQCIHNEMYYDKGSGGGGRCHSRVTCGLTREASYSNTSSYVALQEERRIPTLRPLPGKNRWADRCLEQLKHNYEMPSA